MSTPRRLPLLLALSLLAQASQVVSSLLVARMVLNVLSLHDAAFWYLLAGAIPFIVIFDFGIGTTAAREVAFAVASERSATEIEDLAKTSLILLVLSGLGVLAVGACIVGVVQLFRPAQGDHLLCMAVFGLGSVVKLIGNGTQGLLIGLQRVAGERLVRAGGSVLFCACAWLSLRSSAGVFGLCLAWLIQAVFCVLASTWGVHRDGISLSHGRWRIDIARRLKEPLIQYFLSAVPGILTFNLALYVVAQVLDARAVVALSLMLQIFTGLGLIAALPPSTLTSSWSALWARDQVAAMRRSVLLAFGLVSLSLSAVIAVVGMNTDLTVHVIFGKQSLSGGLFFTLYLLLAATEGLTNCTVWALMATGFVRLAAIGWMSAIGVFVLTWPFTRLFGLAGVPLAVLVSQLLTCYQRNLRMVYRRVGLPAGEIRTWLLVATLPIAMQLACQWLLQCADADLPLPATLRLVSQAVCAAIVAAALFAFMRLRGVIGMGPAAR